MENLLTDHVDAILRLTGRIKFILGHQCAVCLHPTSGVVCHHCLSELPTAHLPCDVCGIELADYGPPEGVTQCADCLKLPKPYTRTTAPFLYAHPLRSMVHKFKHGAPWPLGTWFAEQIACEYQRSHEYRLPHVLVSVPSPRRKLFQRGYNPAHVLATQLARQLHLPVVEPLRRLNNGAEQKTLNRTQRLRSLRNAFSCDQPLSGLRVALIDDVVTTCATAIAASTALLEQGAEEVEVLAIARTP